MSVMCDCWHTDTHRWMSRCHNIPSQWAVCFTLKQQLKWNENMIFSQRTTTACLCHLARRLLCCLAYCIVSSDYCSCTHMNVHSGFIISGKGGWTFSVSLCMSVYKCYMFHPHSLSTVCTAVCGQPYQELIKEWYPVRVNAEASHQSLNKKQGSDSEDEQSNRCNVPFHVVYLIISVLRSLVWVCFPYSFFSLFMTLFLIFLIPHPNFHHLFLSF